MYVKPRSVIELPPAVMTYIASLTDVAATQATKALSYWSKWLELEQRSSLNARQGYCIWEQFFVDHVITYRANDRGDFNLRQTTDSELRRLRLKEHGPLSFRFVQQRITQLLHWQAHQNWDFEVDVERLRQLYRRFQRMQRIKDRLITELPPGSSQVREMLDTCGHDIWGVRDAALIAFSWSAGCSTDDLARMVCSDIGTYDWKTWSYQRSPGVNAKPVHLNDGTTRRMLEWMMESRWRPSLQKKLFLHLNILDELSPSDIGFIFERRFRVSQVLESRSQKDSEKMRANVAPFHPSVLEVANRVLSNAIKMQIDREKKQAIRKEKITLRAQNAKAIAQNEFLQRKNRIRYHWIQFPEKIIGMRATTAAL